MQRLLFFFLYFFVFVSMSCASTTKTSISEKEEVFTDYVRTVVTLKDSKGRDVPAVLTQPKSGINPYMPAIVLHHGGPGGHPINIAGAPRFFPEGAAKDGYASLAILSRHSRFYYNTPFGDAALDIDAAISFFSNYGVESIILGGHSLGAIRVTRYLAETDDPRVKALILFAPTANMPSSVEKGLGKVAYAELVKNAENLVATGQEKQRITFSYEPSSPYWPKGFKISFSHYANIFLDWWGPNAKSFMSKEIANVKKPILMLQGDKDAFLTPTYMDELKALAVSSPRVDRILYENVGHRFMENRPQVNKDAVAWLTDIGLGPRPAVNIELIDTKKENGRQFSGVFYAPTTGEDKSKPVFILLHGWGGDVLWSSNHWLGVRLAQAGYSSIAMRIGVSGRRGIVQRPLESVINDIGMWTDYAAERGYEDIIGEGHSMGGIWWTTYLNNSKDDRVKGVVYLAPTRNASQDIKESLGEEAYNHLVNIAETAVKEGRGREFMISSDLLHDELKPKFPFFQYAAAYLSVWGPDAKSIHTDEIKEVNIPILSIAGSEDYFVDFEYLEKFTKSAGDNAEYRYYDDGAPHSLKGWEDRTASDIIQWTKKIMADK